MIPSPPLRNGLVPATLNHRRPADGSGGHFHVAPCTHVDMLVSRSFLVVACAALVAAVPQPSPGLRQAYPHLDDAALRRLSAGLHARAAAGEPLTQPAPPRNLSSTFACAPLKPRSVPAPSPADRFVPRNGWEIGPVLGRLNLLFTTTPARSHREPASKIEDLHPCDVVAVGAIGDSLTTATTADSRNILDIKNFPGVAWSVGGNAERITMPNIMQEACGKKLIGPSTATNGDNNLNRAVAGAKVADMPEQAVRLVDAMKQQLGDKYESAWKVSWGVLRCTPCHNTGHFTLVHPRR